MIGDLTEAEMEVLEVALLSYSEEMYTREKHEKSELAEELLQKVCEEQ